MKKHFRILPLCLCFTFLACPSFEADLAQNSVSLAVVNTSRHPLCIQDGTGEHCSEALSAQFELNPEYFYERGGVLRFSLNHGDYKIAMLKLGVSSASVYIDPAGKVQTEPGTFEKGFFINSDNSDYLYFSVKPYDLFGKYPLA